VADPPRQPPESDPALTTPRPVVSFSVTADGRPELRQGAGGASLAAGGTLDPSAAGEDAAGLLAAVRAWGARPTVGALERRRAGPHREIDVRATLQGARRTGGKLVRVARRPRRRRPPGLVVAWDVSGSMADQIRYYGAWLAGLVRGRPDVRVFAFGSASAEVTELLADPRDVWKALARFDQWGGGTAIGRALAAIVDTGALRPSTRVVVVSDGWEAAPPEQLAQALARLRDRAARVLWLNPLMATPGYEPVQRGIRVARRYVDRMAAGATYRELARLGATEASRR
jgi:uncharacterized protein with von Willebrand factor type A (vWA) domain